MGNLTSDKDWYSKEKEMVSQFFSESCIVDLDEKNSTLPTNLYSLCSHIENITKYKNADKKALYCLESGGADVAFVNLSSVIHYHSASVLKYYKKLCVNELKYDSGKKEKCYLTWTTPGSIMVHENISHVREDDIYLMLLDLNELFGTQFQGLTPLIFSDETQYLAREVSGLRSKVSYPEILEYLMIYRQSSSKANSPSQKIHFVFFLMLIYLLII